MTGYAKQAILGPVISPLVSKDKGDFSNRANCAGAQFVNNAKALAQDVVVVGGTVAGMKAATKGGKFAQVMSKPVDGIIKLYEKSGLKFPVTKRNAKLLRAIKDFKGSPVAKAVATVGCLGIAGATYILHKTLYKMGQIDQKYTDKAKVKEHQNNVLD